MDEGFVIDYRSLHSVINAWPNAGSKHFRLVKEDDQENDPGRGSDVSG